MKKITRFQDIPQFVSSSSYSVDHSFNHFLDTLEFYKKQGLDLDPDFQRAHVWTEEQQIKYMEYLFRGGRSGRDVYLNCPGWHNGGTTDFVLVDGKQRVNAIVRFLRNEIPIFGSLCREFTDNMRMHIGTIRFHVNSLKTRAECLQWYLDLNTGGTQHTSGEIEKVRLMLAAEPKI